LRVLREQDAPRPSTKVTTGGDSAIAAQNRGADIPALSRQLRGDADAIALKALEKDRKRRYATPSELAADIERYLGNEPVSAHAPSVAYRARKYIRRHRVGVAFAAGGLLLLIGFAAAQAVELRNTRRERDRADRITEFMTGMFKVSDPSEARGNTVTAREILDKASKEIDSSLSKDPELQAKMMYSMAVTYVNLGLYSRAQPLLEHAVEIQHRVLGPESPDALRSAMALANVLIGEGHFTEAEKLARENRNLQRRVLGAEHRDTLLSTHALIVVLMDEGRLQEAEKLQRETLDIDRRLYGPEQPDTLESMYILASILLREGRLDEAEKLQRATLDIRRRVLGPDHPDTLQSASILAATLSEEGKFDEAEKLQRETLDLRRRVLGTDHPFTLESMSMLADTLRVEGHFVEAEELYRETFETERRVFGPEHPETLVTLENYAVDLSNEGRYGDAEKLFREAIQSAGKVNQPGMVANAWYTFACGAAIAGRRDEAFEYLGRVFEYGGEDPEAIAADPDLKSLHGDPRFDALLAKARQNAAPQPR
jgi:eukaryotic-like serine/threonine-protein kinase